MGAALAVSILAHLLLLSWSPHFSPGGVQQSAVPPVESGLRATLNLVDVTPGEPHVKARQPDERTKPSPVAVTPVSDAITSQGRAQTQNAIRLLGYFPVAKLSRMPEAISRFDIQPPDGGDTGHDGRMTIRVWIGKSGAVDHTQIVSSGLPSSYEKVAISAFEKLRFKPGEIDGQPVPTWADIVIEYADFRH